MSSGTPYIGSKISLVSKAEIRYEGFLYTIDQNDSTVTLAKVISLGTEDRVPDSPVPAREEVFEYIVFRGSDIKDLHVCEGPKRVEDPAIVHQSSHSYSQSFNPNYHRSPFTGGIPNFGSYNPFNFHPNGPADISSSRQHTPPSLPRADSRGSQPKNQVGGFQDNNRNSKVRSGESRYKDENDRYSRDTRDNSNNKSSRETRHISEQYDDLRDVSRNKENRDGKNKDRVGRGSRVDRDMERRSQRSSSHENREMADRNTDRDIRDNRDRRNREKESRDSRYVKDNRNYRDNRYRQHRKDNQDDDQQRTGADVSRGQSRGRGGRSYGGRSGGRRGGGGRGGNNRTKFTEDFDFETANAKFNKEEIEKELLKVLKKVKIKEEDGECTELKDEMDEREMDERAPLPSPDKFYDRSKSFFDNILCEAMVPKSEDEVMTRRQEQALNAETFGTSASHYRPGYRGRGRGRGRWRGQGRGGGFYRGRGNYRGSSNRRWVDYEFDYEAAGIKNRHQPLKVSSGGVE